MPIIFLMSAIVSGVALLIALYVVAMKLRRQSVNHQSVAEMAKWLFVFIVVDFALEGLEILSMAYESEEGWEVVSHILSNQLAFSFVGVQVVLGMVVPLAVLGWLLLQGRQVDSKRTALTFASALLVLAGIFAMRWNVVIGGQLFSKSLRGFTTYVPHLLGREGVLVALALLLVPFALLVVLSRLLPPFEREAVAEPQMAQEMPVPARTGLAAGRHVHAATRQGRDVQNLPPAAD
jgi:predicted membrane protein